MIWDWNESSDDAYAESIINIHDVELINIKHIPQCITNLVQEIRTFGIGNKDIEPKIGCTMGSFA